MQGCALGLILFNMEEEAASERERSEIVFWLFSDVGVEWIVHNSPFDHARRSVSRRVINSAKSARRSSLFDRY